MILEKLVAINQGGASLRERLIKGIREAHRNDFDRLFSSLKTKLRRSVDQLTIIPLFGSSNTFEELGSAINFIDKFENDSGSGEFGKLEIIVKYSNGDSISGNFEEKGEAIRFLEYVGVK